MMLDQEKIAEKIMKYCAWRDRCTNEVLRKLTELGATEKLSQKLIKQLTEERFLDDHRFALSFARGKLAHNQWGKMKIVYALRAFQIDKEFIDEAINNLDDDLYHDTMRKLAQKKSASLKRETDHYVKQQKIFAYLASKGFEPHLINDVVKEQLRD